MSKFRNISDYLVFYIKRYGAKFVRWFRRNALPILLFTIFCILIGLFSYFYYNDPDFELISYLSGFSSVFVAILTLFYVLTTSKQLSVMNKQLKQMENDSKQTKKALLFLNNTELIIKPPNFKYAEAIDNYSFCNECEIVTSLDNLIDQPAISISLFGKVEVNFNHRKSYLTIFEDSTGILPGQKNKNCILRIEKDREHRLIQALRRKEWKPSIDVNIKIYYKSMTGGHFLEEIEYGTVIEELGNKDFELINNWCKCIDEFQSRFSNDIENMKKTRIIAPDKWDSMYKDIIEKINNEVLQDNICIEMWPRPGLIDINDIDEERFYENLNKESNDRLLLHENLGFNRERIISL